MEHEDLSRENIIYFILYALLAMEQVNQLRQCLLGKNVN